MKKINFYTLLLMLTLTMTFGFASCSSDDDSGSSNAIVGYWVEEHSATNSYYAYEFKSDGTLIEKIYDNYDHLSDQISYTYAYDGNSKITVKYGNYTFIITVTSFDGNRMELYNNISDETIDLRKAN